jgi:hypothetical protein
MDEGERIEGYLNTLTEDILFSQMLEVTGPDGRQAGHPVWLQRCHLLLLDDEVQDLASRGAKVLDVACGNGVLVEYLRREGVNAEGICSQAPNKPYFMSQNITSVYPMDGCIPKESGLYDLVLMNSIPEVIYNFNTMPNRNESWKEHYMDAFFILAESFRVLAPGGRFVTFPALRKLEKGAMDDELEKQKCKVYREYSYHGNTYTIHGSARLEPEIYGYRTVVEKLVK